ncbi:MAG: PilZ domain-containing protein [Deltaproteobacteria bacterium]|nr:PilZ domain-containing protein [Deltaproteobacteria bacterium]
MAGKAEIFVNQENMALLSCPHCGSMKHVSVEKFKNKKHSLQVKCVCTQTFNVDLNFRKRYRKQTDLAGYFCKISLVENSEALERKRPNCKIVNLSMGGLGFRHETQVRLEVGDELLIDFTLDDRKKSRLQRKIIVRHVGEQGYIGAEFSASDQQLYEKTLGFYLMP